MSPKMSLASAAIFCAREDPVVGVGVGLGVVGWLFEAGVDGGA